MTVMAVTELLARRPHAAVSLSTFNDMTRPEPLVHKAVQAAGKPRLVKIKADATSAVLAHKTHATGETRINVKMRSVPLAHTAQVAIKLVQTATAVTGEGTVPCPTQDATVTCHHLRHHRLPGRYKNEYVLPVSTAREHGAFQEA
jgi:hypothetical protein